MPEQEETLDVESAADDLAKSLFDGEALNNPNGQVRRKEEKAEEKEEPEEEIEEEQKIEAKELEEESEEEIEDDVEAEEKPNLTQKETDEAPQTWPKDMRKYWEGLPAELKSYWHLREKQMLDGLQQYKEAATFGTDIAKALQPFEQDFQQNQVTPAQGIAYLLNANRMLTQGPIESRRKAYEDLGRRIGVLENQGQTADNSHNPNLQPLEQELQAIKAQLGQQQLREQEIARKQAEKEIEAFTNDPAHPYFDEVVDDMIPLLQAGSSLQEAYDLAVKKNPITYQREIDRIKKEHEEFLKAEQAKQAQKAKKAKSVNLKSRSTAEEPTEPLGSMEQTMSSILSEIESRS